MNKPTWIIHQGDALTVLKTLPSESVHCVVTSPPYWGLRDYGVEGQLGLERTPEEYVARLVEIFRDLKRVLRKDGTLWLNLGDSYSGSNGNGNQPQTRVNLTAEYFTSFQNVTGRIAGLKPKDLVGIPWMVAFALRLDGWYLRSDVIWSKNNPMPESVTDRPTRSHEYIFLLARSRAYYYDSEAVKERAVTGVYDGSHQSFGTPGGKVDATPGKKRKESGKKWERTMGGSGTSFVGHSGNHKANGDPIYGLTRNVRSVWNITTQPFPEAHFATFPEKLVQRCLLAGVSEGGVCANCGSPWKRIVEVDDPEGRLGKSYHDHVNDLGVGQRGVPPASGAPIKQTVGWEPSCKCDAPTIPATILDPFSGSGTTGVVATKMGYNYIGIELNPEYVAMSERRLEAVNQQHGVFV